MTPFCADAESGWQWTAGGDAAEASDPETKAIAAKWQKFIEKHEQSDEKIYANKAEMKDLCRKHGVARVHRTKLWFAFSGAHRMRKVLYRLLSGV